MGSHRNGPQDETSTVLRAQVDTAPRAFPVYALTVIEGPDRGLAFSIDGLRPNRVLVGQSAACEVRLTDPQVSRRHATLDSSELGLHLCDLLSTNGTTVNGIRIVEAHLRGGEVIGFGGTLVAVEAQAAAPEAPASTEMRFGRVVGASPEMRRLYPLCRRVAESDVPVVVEGETGTGKELLAESLHEASARAGGPFVVFDCTAVAPNLMESSLFGHERGAPRRRR